MRAANRSEILGLSNHRFHFKTLRQGREINFGMVGPDEILVRLLSTYSGCRTIKCSGLRALQNGHLRIVICVMIDLVIRRVFQAFGFVGHAMAASLAGDSISS